MVGVPDTEVQGLDVFRGPTIHQLLTVVNTPSLVTTRVSHDTSINNIVPSFYFFYVP